MPRRVPACHVSRATRSQWMHGLTRRACVAGVAGSAAEADRYFVRALELEPGSSAAWNGRGHGLQQLRRQPEAASCLARAIALEPGSVAAWYNAGVVLRCGARGAGRGPLLDCRVRLTIVFMRSARSLAGRLTRERGARAGRRGGGGGAVSCGAARRRSMPTSARWHWQTTARALDRRCRRGLPPRPPSQVTSLPRPRRSWSGGWYEPCARVDVGLLGCWVAGLLGCWLP
jgi:hypothetical protein